jgi:hypothetical protein
MTRRVCTCKGSLKRKMKNWNLLSWNPGKEGRIKCKVCRNEWRTKAYYLQHFTVGEKIRSTKKDLYYD